MHVTVGHGLAQSWLKGLQTRVVSIGTAWCSPGSRCCGHGRFPSALTAAVLAQGTAEKGVFHRHETLKALIS